MRTLSSSPVPAVCIYGVCVTTCSLAVGTAHLARWYPDSTPMASAMMSSNRSKRMKTFAAANWLLSEGRLKNKTHDCSTSKCGVLKRVGGCNVYPVEGGGYVAGRSVLVAVLFSLPAVEHLTQQSVESETRRASERATLQAAYHSPYDTGHIHICICTRGGAWHKISFPAGELHGIPAAYPSVCSTRW